MKRRFQLLSPGRLHTHIRVLILLSVIVNGGMYLAYPLQNVLDDNQAYHRYMIDELLNGNPLIGNLRYNSGYPLVIYPAAAFAQLVGRLEERVIHLFQISLNALIPFLLYDTVRRFHSRQAGFLVALLTLLDPFGAQWANFYLPVWLVAFCFTLSVWIISRALQQGLRRGPVVVAGLVLGIATLARLNVAPMVALIGTMLLFLRHLPLRRRLEAFVT